MRDYTLFPDDENGDVLYEMMQDGDNLRVSRDIDFAVVFPNKTSANEFVNVSCDLDATFLIEEYEEEDGLVWSVIVTKDMVPTHQSITDFEKILEEKALPFAGQNDGWGCISQ